MACTTNGRSGATDATQTTCLMSNIGGLISTYDKDTEIEKLTENPKLQTQLQELVWLILQFIP
eukprot:COSAG02_NODE_4733_length_5040_cov_3.321392_3_plen_63_part_00